ncbi:MAG: hypothetical protein HPY53_03240 [Brevinematales bacterium]|nr:hypothetical protein [Brevinematales bacterium]
MKKVFAAYFIGFAVLIALSGCAPALFQTITETEAFVGKWFLSEQTPPGTKYTKDTTLSIYQFNSNKTFTSFSRTNGGDFLTNTGTYAVDETNNLMFMYSSITSTNNYNFVDSGLWQKISNMYILDYNPW